MPTLRRHLDLGDGYAFRKASLLDVPFIFELVMAGSEAGVFTPRYQRLGGYVALFKIVLLGVLRLQGMPGLTGRDYRWWIIYHQDQDQELGCMQVFTEAPEQGPLHKHLMHFALADEHKGQGHGKRILQRFIALQPAGAVILVICTKQAKAMQHLVKRLHFRRNTKGGLPAEEYSLVVPPTRPS